MSGVVLSYNEWKIHNEKRIESHYLVQDLHKAPIWNKILYREYMKYLDHEKEISDEL
jgi:hypothetical protein